MDTRKEQLLKLIIENYIETAEPIGSKFLAEQSDLGVSGATLRNEMRDLEDVGLLMHPHTSAGRMPTEAGYQYYVAHLMERGVLAPRLSSELKEIAASQQEKDQRMKAAARYVADTSKNAVIIVWSIERFYYTGLSSLFSQPEFQEYGATIRVSSIFDECEDRLEDVFDASPVGEVTVLIGSKNPLGGACSAVVARPKDIQMIAIIGPLRMNYEQNFLLARQVYELV